VIKPRGVRPRQENKPPAKVRNPIRRAKAKTPLHRRASKLVNKVNKARARRVRVSRAKVSKANKLSKAKVNKPRVNRGKVNGAKVNKVRANKVRANKVRANKVRAKASSRAAREPRIKPPMRARRKVRLKVMRLGAKTLVHSALAAIGELARPGQTTAPVPQVVTQRILARSGAGAIGIGTAY
jgi:hypothetical protein